jgi:hypothetical protein
MSTIQNEASRAVGASPDPDAATRDAIIEEWSRIAPLVVRADALARYAATRPGVRDNGDPETRVMLQWWDQYHRDLAAAQSLFEAVRSGVRLTGPSAAAALSAISDMRESLESSLAVARNRQLPLPI